MGKPSEMLPSLFLTLKKVLRKTFMISVMLQIKVGQMKTINHSRNCRIKLSFFFEGIDVDSRVIPEESSEEGPNIQKVGLGNSSDVGGTVVENVLKKIKP